MQFGQSWSVSARVLPLARARRGRYRDFPARCLLVGMSMLGIAIALPESLALPGAGTSIAAAAAAEGSANERAPLGRSAPPKNRCLSRQEQRARIAAHAAIPLGKAVRAVKGRGDLIRARLCEREGRLLYLLTILGRSGKVLRLAVDAKTGRLVGAPR